MASAGYTWAQQNLPGGVEAYYSNINNYLASGKSPEEIAQAMQTYGISAEDVQAAKASAAPAPATETVSMTQATPAATATIPNIRNIGFRYVDIPDPTVGEGSVGTATGAVFFDKTTGKEIPQELGNNQFLVVDRATGQPKIQQGATDSFLGGLTGRIKDIAASPAGQMIISAIVPVLGQEVAASLKVSQAVGTAIASTAAQIASGVDPEKALQNAITNAVVSTGSNAVAKEINSAMTGMDKATAAAISNAAGSALSSAATTAAKGGSSSDIINSAVAGVAGSVTSSVTGDRVLGGAVTGGLTGGIPGAAAGAASAAARPSTTTPTRVSQDLSSADAALLAYNLGLEQGLTPEQSQQKAMEVLGGKSAGTQEAFLPAAVYGGVALSPAVQAAAGAGAAAVTGGIGWLMSLIDGAPAPASEQEKNVGTAIVEFIRANPTANTADVTAQLQQIFPELKQEQVQQIQQNQNNPQLMAQIPQEVVITAKKLPSETRATQQYTPEITATPAYVVAAVDATGKKALVYDAQGNASVVNVPAGSTVKVNQSVNINPSTNQIVGPSRPGTAGASGGGAAGGAGAAGGLSGGEKGLITGGGAGAGLPGAEGAGAGPGAEAGEGRGTGTGTGTGTGAGTGAGTTVGAGAGAGSGAGVGSGTGVTYISGEGAGVSEGTGKDTGGVVGGISSTGPGGQGAGEGAGAGGGAGGGEPPTYKPAITTAVGVTPYRQTSLASVLQGQYPMSTTGLTAYRPAGEIESEESGKQRRDVWNEASLRLKDALGL